MGGNGNNVKDIACTELQKPSRKHKIMVGKDLIGQRSKVKETRVGKLSRNCCSENILSEIEGKRKS